jgi:hypothetical protein
VSADARRVGCRQRGRGKSAASRRRGKLRSKYGITPEDYAEMYVAQDGRCAVCGAARDVLSIDHCHATGAVRGLLCRECNIALGLLKDDPAIIERAAEYLRARIAA